MHVASGWGTCSYPTIRKQAIVENTSREIILYSINKQDNYTLVHKNATIERREICPWKLPRVLSWDCPNHPNGICTFSFVVESPIICCENVFTVGFIPVCRIGLEVASFPGLPRFSSSVCVQYNTRKLPCSLVPRPFPPPVFDRIQYAIKNWRWERPGNEASFDLTSDDGTIALFQTARRRPTLSHGTSFIPATIKGRGQARAKREKIKPRNFLLEGKRDFRENLDPRKFPAIRYIYFAFAASSWAFASYALPCLTGAPDR